MNVMLFGATGMVGLGVLRECLLDSRVSQVLTVGRQRTGQVDPKLTELVPKNLFDLADVADQLAGFDACFFCLGVSAAAMSETDYRRLTYDLTLSIAGTLVTRNPAMTFIYVSGEGTDSSERGRMMWARVKGATENGITSRNRLYRVAHAVVGSIYPVLKALLPNFLTTTTAVGRAMIRTAMEGGPGRILTNRDINAIAIDPGPTP